jgi:hypothetical protein
MRLSVDDAVLRVNDRCLENGEGLIAFGALKSERRQDPEDAPADRAGGPVPEQHLVVAAVFG